jgi:hypothetical protein
MFQWYFEISVFSKDKWLHNFFLNLELKIIDNQSIHHIENNKSLQKHVLNIFNLNVRLTKCIWIFHHINRNVLNEFFFLLPPIIYMYKNTSTQNKKKYKKVFLHLHHMPLQIGRWLIFYKLQMIVKDCKTQCLQMLSYFASYKEENISHFII